MEQIEFIQNTCSGRYATEEFSFMFDIMQMNLLTRRSLANTYPVRFFMKGPAKKKFFDFVQAELELSLEKLSMLLQ